MQSFIYLFLITLTNTNVYAGEYLHRRFPRQVAAVKVWGWMSAAGVGNLFLVGNNCDPDDLVKVTVLPDLAGVLKDSKTASLYYSFPAVVIALSKLYYLFFYRSLFLFLKNHHPSRPW